MSDSLRGRISPRTVSAVVGIERGSALHHVITDEKKKVDLWFIFNIFLIILIINLFKNVYNLHAFVLRFTRIRFAFHKTGHFVSSVKDCERPSLSL